MKILYLPNYKAQQRQFEKNNYNPYPVRLASEAEWYRKQGHEVHWGNAIGKYDKIISEPENLPFLTLPKPDRVFTKAKEYTSGNYKYLPGTHILSASGCWHGKCSFCVEQGKPYELRPVEDVISEIEECKRLGFKECFDDSATFPVGNWADSFWGTLIERNNKTPIGCNMRIVDADFMQMKAGGCRMLLVGVESINQATLDKIQKGTHAEEIEPTLKKISEAGLSAHLTCMLGYPFETDEDSIRTLKFIWRMLRKGYAETAQASFYSPTGSTQVEHIISNESQRKYINKLYYIGFSPQYWFHRLRGIRDINDIKYIWRGIKEGVKALCLTKTH